MINSDQSGNSYRFYSEQVKPLPAPDDELLQSASSEEMFSRLEYKPNGAEEGLNPIGVARRVKRTEVHHLPHRASVAPQVSTQEGRAKSFFSQVSSKVKDAKDYMTGKKSPPSQRRALTSREVEARRTSFDRLREQAKEEEILEEPMPDRSRNDLVVYGNQFLTSTTSAVDLLYGEIVAKIRDETGVNSLPQEKREEIQPGSLEERVETLYNNALSELANLEAGLKYRPALNGLSEEVISALHSNDEELATGAEVELNRSLRQPIESTERDFLERAKRDISEIQASCNCICEQFIDQARAEMIDAAIVSVSVNQDIEKLKASIPTYIRAARTEMINARAEWDRERPGLFPVSVTARNGEQIGVVSAFRAAGKPYSSALSRDRLAEESCVANFFESYLQSSEEQVACATRSAVLVEFGLDLASERQRTTRENVKQVLDYHTREMVKDREGERIGSEQEPIILNYQQLLLLTPDFARNLLAKNSSFVGRADNERLLVEESFEANQFWNNRTQEVEITVGEEVKRVWVKYEIQTFNVPCNRFHEASLKNPIKRRNVSHPLTDQMNRAGLEQLTKNKIAVCAQIEREMKTLQSTLIKAEIEAIEDLEVAFDTKQEKRKKISSAILRQRNVASLFPKKWLNQASLVKEWAATADQAARLCRDFQPSTEGAKKYLELLEKRERIIDLHADVHELISTRAYMDPDIQDGNRYALGSRILYLGQMLSQACHFGCRSGKDRTGIQDDDYKLLVAESIAEGRVFSYLEAEGIDSHQENRTAFHDQSGNAEFNPRANLGGLAWWNVGGARITPKNPKLAAQRSKQYDAKQSATSVFSRP